MGNLIFQNQSSGLEKPDLPRCMRDFSQKNFDYSAMYTFNQFLSFALCRNHYIVLLPSLKSKQNLGNQHKVLRTFFIVHLCLFTQIAL